MLPKHPACPHTSPEGTVAPLQGHSEGAPAAPVLFSMGPLPGFFSPSGALLHPDVHLLTPILLPGLQAVQKAFLQQAQTVTWNTPKAAYRRGGRACQRSFQRRLRMTVRGAQQETNSQSMMLSQNFSGGTKELFHTVKALSFWRPRAIKSTSLRTAGTSLKNKRTILKTQRLSVAFLPSKVQWMWGKCMKEGIQQRREWADPEILCHKLQPHQLIYMSHPGARPVISTCSESISCKKSLSKGTYDLSLLCRKWTVTQT